MQPLDLIVQLIENRVPGFFAHVALTGDLRSRSAKSADCVSCRHPAAHAGSARAICFLAIAFHRDRRSSRSDSGGSRSASGGVRSDSGGDTCSAPRFGSNPLNVDFRDYDRLLDLFTQMTEARCEPLQFLQGTPVQPGFMVYARDPDFAPTLMCGSAITLLKTPNASGERVAGVSIKRMEPVCPTVRASRNNSRRSRMYEASRSTM